VQLAAEVGLSLRKKPWFDSLPRPRQQSIMSNQVSSAWTVAGALPRKEMWVHFFPRRLFILFLKRLWLNVCLKDHSTRRGKFTLNSSQLNFINLSIVNHIQLVIIVPIKMFFLGIQLFTRWRSSVARPGIQWRTSRGGTVGETAQNWRKSSFFKFLSREMGTKKTIFWQYRQYPWYPMMYITRFEGHCGWSRDCLSTNQAPNECNERSAVDPKTNEYSRILWTLGCQNYPPSKNGCFLMFYCYGGSFFLPTKNFDPRWLPAPPNLCEGELDAVLCPGAGGKLRSWWTNAATWRVLPIPCCGRAPALRLQYQVVTLQLHDLIWFDS
jgi:hypothetical protein